MNESGRPDEYDDNVIDLKPKEIKCSHCQLRVPYDHEQITLSIDTCKFKNSNNEHACQLKHTYEFITRLVDKSKNIPKRLPIPALLDKSRAATNITQEEAVRRINQLFETLPANDEEEKNELTVGEPIRILIAKNGHINEQTVD